MKRVFVIAGCYLLAVVFGWAGAAKVADPATFAQSIASFQLVPWPVAVVLSCYLPWLELLTALALLIPRFRSAALGIATALSASFTILWLITLARGLNVTCGCFGPSTTSDNLLSLSRAAALLLLCVALVRANRHCGPKNCPDVSS